MNIDQPLVSVIIPLYNAEKYIAACITSVLDQTWANIEVIIIDDGSKDNSLALAKSFESNKVKVCAQQNKGAGAARNKGLAVAKGDYIQFLDADDLLKPNKIAVALQSISEHSNAMAVCPVVHFKNEDETQLQQLKPSEYELAFYKSSNDTYGFLLSLYGAEDNKGSMIPLHCWLTPAELIKKAGLWNEDLTVNDDGEFFCRVVLLADQVCFSDDTVCYYRRYTHAGSLSSASSEHALKSELNAIQLIRQHLEGVIASDTRINKVIARLYGELIVKTYPKYPLLYKKILVQLKNVNQPLLLPTLGGTVIELIKRFAGWRTARLLQHYNPFSK